MICLPLKPFKGKKVLVKGSDILLHNSSFTECKCMNKHTVLWALCLSDSSTYIILSLVSQVS